MKYYIPYAEFYITNVCNMTCNGCNRFNNLDFTGFQKWEDYSDIYKQWAEEFDLGWVAILGGEPMLNPTFKQWVIGVSELWPGIKIQIVTNGTRLEYVPWLRELMEQNNNIEISVGIHNINDVETITSKVKDFLGQETNIYNRYLVNRNGAKVKIENQWRFHQSALITTDTGYTLHDSDPELAFATCEQKTCHHFVKGMLYKCGTLAVLPDFNKQHALELSETDRNLMEEYKPLSITDSTNDKTNFVNSLGAYVPQCKFCPEHFKIKHIFSTTKNSK